jgi:hypothetical protein
VGRRGRKRARGDEAAAATTDYEDAEGNVLTLRDSLSPGTMRKLSEGVGGAASTRDDMWQRHGELMFERLAVSWIGTSKDLARANPPMHTGQQWPC